MEEIEIRMWLVLRVMMSHLSSAGIFFDVPAPLLGMDEFGKYKVKFVLMSCKQVQKMDILNLRNTWVSFLNKFLEMHADVIADRQINQAQNEFNELGLYEKICKTIM